MTKNNVAKQRAYRRAGAKLGFYIHLTAYVTVNPFLAFINYRVSPQYWWCLWPLFGWGIGLVFHWFAVYIGPRLMQQLFRRELERDGTGD